MAVRLGDAVFRLDTLRFEPSPKRVRALLAGRVVVDTDRAVLVWEPRRVTPVYAVPTADVDAAIVAAEQPAPPDLATSPAVWTPQVPFDVRLTSGRLVRIEVPGHPGAPGFLPDDPDLDGLVVLDFAAFDWLEDDDPIVAHPHDPFSRIDVRASRAEYRLSLSGEPVALSRRVRILYETGLPPRLYFPPADLLVRLEPSTTRSACAYKGDARYFSATIGAHRIEDIAWSYPDPLLDGEPVRGRIAFFEERLDLSIDGRACPQRPSPFA
ncbi:MAG: DUF427 domain-containing protein [Micrococcales bacterium]|nr:DUF427 domain-containing protein [Micrococcales bacterium]